MTLSLERSTGVDFLHPTGFSSNALFIRNDLDSQTALHFLWLPLTAEVWACVVAFAACTAVAITSLRQTNSHEERYPERLWICPPF